MKSERVRVLWVVGLIICGLAANALAVFDVYVTGNDGKLEHYDSTGTFIDIPVTSGAYYGIARAPDGKLWIAGSLGVKSYDPGTGTVSSLYSAGGLPYGVAIDQNGIPYAGNDDHGNLPIYKFNGTSFALFASSPCTDPSGGNLAWWDLRGMAFGPDGNLYASALIYDAANNCYDAIERFNGTTGAYSDSFFMWSDAYNFAEGLAFRDGKLYVARGYEGKVYYFDAATGTQLGSIDCGTPPNVYLKGITFGPDGNLYVADYANSKILKCSGTNFSTVEDFVATTHLPAYIAIVDRPGISTLTGTVNLEGYTGDNLTVGVKIELRQDGVSQGAVYMTLGADGKFTVPNVANGTYDIAIKTYAHLQKVIHGFNVDTDPKDMGTITLFAGNCNGDNEVNSTDLSILLANMDKVADH